MLKIKNLKHFDTADEIITELLDKLQKMSSEAEDIGRGSKPPEEKLKALEYLQTRYAALSDFLDNELGYSIRTDDGMMFTQVCFNRIFYFRQAAEIELAKKRGAK